MLRDSLKVFLAVALGIYIGTIVGREVSAMFCWIGAVIGGITGYLSYEWKQIPTAIPQAYKSIKKSRLLSNSGWCMFCGLNLGIWLSLILGTMFAYSVISDFHKKGEPVDEIFVVCACCSLFGLIGFASGVIIFLVNENNREEINELCFDTFIFVVIFCYLPKLLFFCTKNMPRFIKWFVAGCILVAKEWGSAIKKFFWNLFLLIHSQKRIICGVDALIGSALAIVFGGEPLVWALCGGLCGVINYVLITELWLKPFGYIPIKT